MSPLSPSPNTALNRSSPPASIHYDKYEGRSFTQSTAASSAASTSTTATATDASTDASIAGSETSASTPPELADNNCQSSPFMSAVDADDRAAAAAVAAADDDCDDAPPGRQEDVSPSKKNRHSRILSGNELSPLRLITGVVVRNASAGSAPGGTDTVAEPTASARGSRRSLARFPVRVHSPAAPSSPSPTPPPSTPQDDERVPERQMSIDEALEHNTGLAKAIEIFEDEEEDEDEDADGQSDTGSVIVRSRVRDGYGLRDDQEGREALAKMSVNLGFGSEQPSHADASEEDPAAGDDTMVSTFSTFSAVPNLTMFSKLGGDAARAGGHAAQVNGMMTPTPRGRPDPSPFRGGRPYSLGPGNTANLLMDFADGFRYPSKSPSRPGNDTPTSTPRQGGTATANLMDFEIPPLPTPRSIPSITPRELESLKSGFLSEISSLKASLSGKEAEVSSLKTAVGDAEKRVGECMEQVREERAAREHLSAEKDSWERSSREMEGVLRKVRDEIVITQREREELESKLDESEKRREAAEIMAQEAESKMAGLRAGKAAEERGREAATVRSPTSTTTVAASAREVEQAVERVARELHALYKSKHEAKVAALKKSYEGRWEKRVRELETRLAELATENERLRAGHDTTLARIELHHAAGEERKVQASRDAAQLREFAAEVDRLEAFAASVQRDNGDLRKLLEHERVEKGELVQLAEEMMAMQSFVAAAPAPARPSADHYHHPTPTHPAPAMAPVPTSHSIVSPRKSMPPPARTPAKVVSRAAPLSGLRAPGGGGGGGGTESRIGRTMAAAGNAHERTRSGGGGALPRLGGGVGGSGLAMRSGIMSSLEKLGNYRNRGD